MTWAPMTGSVLGSVAGLPTLMVHRGDGARAVLLATVAIGLLALLTRGLHLDGLADTADGLGSHRPASGALAVMRRGDVGPFGVTTLVLTLLGQVSALAACAQAYGPPGGLAALALACVTGRLAVVHALTPRTPAARADGLGALVAGTVPAHRAVVLTLAVGVTCAVPGLLGHPRVSVAALGALAAGVLAAGLVRRHVVRRLGGITGDVLGALVEVGSGVALLVLALAT